ncbi:PilZ domain-containing protein [Paucidesulfovibrio longus]|uniref:PilZ domain-containing protein n=1 Tax=Paucidesulfovibrio longus TaxID=889 RepID=UPI0003B37631|nr:PilZ domain-containing protein [Paucidesulfovibrio longus]
MRELDISPEGRIACSVDFQELRPQYGDRILIKPAGLDYRLPTSFVGMEPRSYVIVRLSALGLNQHQVYPLLEKGNSLKMFINCDDMLVGFLADSLAFNAAPYRHLYISYPAVGESFTLRQHDRFECHLPATVETLDGVTKGMLLDISRCGCRACLDYPDSAEPPGKGALVDLTFSLLSRDRTNTMLCEVRNVSRAKGRLVLGLLFVDPGKTEQDRLESFLAFLERYRPPAQNARR